MEDEESTWVEVRVAPDQIVAEMWQEFLADQSIPAMLEPGDVMSFLGISSMPVRLLVPEGEVERATALLDEFEQSEVDPAELDEVAVEAEPEPGEAELIAEAEAAAEAAEAEDEERDDARG